AVGRPHRRRAETLHGPHRLRPRRRLLAGRQQLVSCSGLLPLGEGWKLGTLDYTARVWNVQGDGEPGVFKGHTYAVLAVAFASDGQRVVSAGADGTVRLWDAKTAKEIDKYTEHKERWVRTVALTVDGAFALTGGDDTLMHVWELPMTLRHLIDAA